jgi:hypothetical protein
VAKLTCKHCGKPIELDVATYAGPRYRHSDPKDDKECHAAEPEVPRD